LAKEITRTRSKGGAGRATKSDRVMSTERRTPRVERICCVCRTKKPVGDMIRVARVNGEFKIDKTNGRGAYVCPECVEKCIKTRALNRSFKTQVPQDVYDKLRT